MQQSSTWLVAGRYQVGDVVGRGGYGMVCRGLDTHNGRAVALKMLSPEAGRDADVVERMLREQQALVALSGTCAVTAIDLCRLESGAPCLVMEWLDGLDLEQQLSSWESQAELGSYRQLLALFQPLCDTLERAHSIGIVHRDIKPANIFLTPKTPPGVRLLDFGLSRMKSAAPLTAVGMVMGSPSYIAPETWRGNSAALDGRADLFALGVIAFRWLTGKLPFEASDLIGKMTAVTSGPRPSARALRPELPSSIDAWLARVLAIEPQDRFQTAKELYGALAAALSDRESQQSPSASAAPRAAPPAADDEPKGVLATAFRAAAALLKRFTAPRDAEPAPAPVTAPAAIATEPVIGVAAVVPPTTTDASTARADVAVTPVVDDPSPEHELSTGDRRTVWLDSDELQEIVPEPAAPAPEASTEPSPEPVQKRQRSKRKPAAKAKPKRAAKTKPKKSRKTSSRRRGSTGGKTRS